MATTLSIKNRLDRVTVIKIAASHGWYLDKIFTGNPANRGEKIIDADIKTYVLYPKIGKQAGLVAYQPKTGEITLIGPAKDYEAEMEKEIMDVFENEKIGDLPVKNRSRYLKELSYYSLFLTKKELDGLMAEVKDANLGGNIDFYA